MLVRFFEPFPYLRGWYLTYVNVIFNRVVSTNQSASLTDFAMVVQKTTWKCPNQHICYHHATMTDCLAVYTIATQIARFMGPTWGPPGSFRPQMGPMLAPWTLLSRYLSIPRSLVLTEAIDLPWPLPHLEMFVFTPDRWDNVRSHNGYVEECFISTRSHTKIHKEDRIRM